MGNLVLSSYLFIKGLIFDILWIFFLLFLHDVLRLLHVLKIFIIIINRMCCCFFVFYPVRRIYVWSTTFQIYFVTIAMQQINTIKDVTLPFIDVSNPVWYLERNDSKSSWKVFVVSFNLHTRRWYVLVYYNSWLSLY